MIDENQSVRRWLPLVLISALGLFLELAIIRWISGEVRLFSYLKNIPLLAAFLGLAIGFALVGKGRDYKSTFAPLFAIYIILVIVFGRYSSPNMLTYPSSGGEFVWFTAHISYWLSLLLFMGVVLIFFFLTMFLFIPLGQATGEEMDRFKPVPAYIVNIIASLLGAWSFTLISFFQAQPVVWFSIAMAGMAVYFYLRHKLSRLNMVLFATTTLVLVAFSGNAIWSPYQRLSVSPEVVDDPQGKPIDIGYVINVQQIFHQTAINLSDDLLRSLKGTIPELDDAAYAYNLPYRIRPQGSQVLIVGAGAGNDVAAALRSDIVHIDAVEIDPAILDFGVQLHPERPYDDGRVTMIVDDARSFFESTQKQYDIIVFGFLDSHTLISGWSSIRLDSYIYTLESFTQVREHLKADGITMVAFAAHTPWIEERLGRMLVEVFGEGKVWMRRGTSGTIFVAGQLSQGQLDGTDLGLWYPDPRFDDLAIPTDDWPYLYMQGRFVPKAYWQTLLLIGLVTLIFMARSFPEAIHPDWHFWFLGAAFLLIEFTSVTRLALLFGTTWLVNALAISGVLVMILCANLIVLRSLRINLRLIYPLLFVSLGLVYFFPLGALNQLVPFWRAIGSMLLLSLPLFFSGLIFSESLRRTGSAAAPLASNLSGSVFGGVLEYGALVFGVHNLYILAFVVYGLAWLAFLRRRA